MNYTYDMVRSCGSLGRQACIVIIGINITTILYVTIPYTYISFAANCLLYK